jgi:hypothetical protein
MAECNPACFLNGFAGFQWIHMAADYADYADFLRAL